MKDMELRKMLLDAGTLKEVRMSPEREPVLAATLLQGMIDLHGKEIETLTRKINAIADSLHVAKRRI